MTTDLSTRLALLSFSTGKYPSAGMPFFIRVHKIGQVRQGQVYGDDEVSVLLWVGFSYPVLRTRSNEMLSRRLTASRYLKDLWIQVRQTHPSTTMHDVLQVVQDLQSTLEIEKDPDGSYESALWRPLTHGGTMYPQFRVYQGTDPEKRGNIYVRGLKLGEVVETPAKNGHWQPDSKPRTVIRTHVRESLPVGLFRTYKVTEKAALSACTGGDATRQALSRGVQINADAFQVLLDVYSAAPR